jgi:hypothetical protein
MSQNCENCEIPQGSYSHPGYLLKVAFVHPDDKNWGRNRYAFTRRTVWTCSPECAVQTIFVAQFAALKKVTPTTVEWPISLREFTARMNAAGKLEFLKRGLKRDKPPTQTAENMEVHEISNLNMEELYAGRLREEFVTPLCASTGGRPLLKNPSAATRRKRRQRAQK